jgi:hypothetical protein
MAVCPHCGERLPMAVDAFCPSCGNALDEPPARPLTRSQQREVRQQHQFAVWQVLGGLLAVAGLINLATGRVITGATMLVLGVLGFAEGMRRANKSP